MHTKCFYFNLTWFGDIICRYNLNNINLMPFKDDHDDDETISHIVHEAKHTRANAVNITKVDPKRHVFFTHF